MPKPTKTVLGGLKLGLGKLGLDSADRATTTTPDVTGPVPQTFTPADNATGVSLGTTISVQFDENIFLNAASAGVFRLREDTGGGFVEIESYSPDDTTSGTGDNGGSISVSGDTLTFSPGAALQNSASYAIRVSNSDLVRDASNNEWTVDRPTNDTAWNWTTVAAGTVSAGSLMYTFPLITKGA